MQRLTFSFLLAVLTVGTFFTTAAFAKGSDNRSEQAELKARNHLARQGVNPSQLKAKDIIVDETGSHVRFSQFHDGVRIYGSEVITHEKANGKFAKATGELAETADLSTEHPIFAKNDAEVIVWQAFGKYDSGEIELVYYPTDSGMTLAYLVDVKNTDTEVQDPRREMIVIDAQTGVIIDRWNNLQHIAALGTGKGYYAGTVNNFPIDLANGTYTMFDVPNNAKTYDYNNRSCNIFGCGTSVGTIYSDADGVFGTDGSLSNRASIGVDAHFFSQKVLEYVLINFGRRGIDNNNNASLRMRHMVSRTHYGKSYANAFWDGASMTYGDGDSTIRPFDSLDVVGHEMTHGITERTSNLRYQNESGAANESFSDIIGVAVEFYTGTLTGFGGQSYPADWWIGEDLYKSSNPANPTRGIRHMADPHIEGDPCHYSERYTGTSDSGGVHINSGIQNKVYYLLSSGGTNHKDTTGTVVTGIGWADAAKIAFDADTKYCTIDDTYAKVANAWVNAAKVRFGAGSTPAVQTYNAWKSGGVTPSVTP